MSRIESQALTWLATHMFTHAHMTQRIRPHTHTHTYTSRASEDPLWGQEHQCPCGFLPYGIMLGWYFYLLGWLLDMVFIWIGNLFSFESICSVEERIGWLRRGVAISSKCLSGLTWRTWTVAGGRKHLRLGVHFRPKINEKNPHCY